MSGAQRPLRQLSLSVCVVCALSVLVACEPAPDDSPDEQSDTFSATSPDIVESDPDTGVLDDSVSEDQAISEDTTTPPADDIVLSVGDQSLSLSTIVTIERVSSPRPSLVVVHEDDGAGNSSATLGYLAVIPGDNRNLEVAVDRPLKDGEILHATLHDDANDNLALEPGTDPVVVSSSGEVKSGVFSVSVSSTIPAAQIRLSNDGTSAYRLLSAEPGMEYVWTGESPLNPTLILHPGWRYQIINQVTASHPFELYGLRSDGVEVALLSQVQGGYLEDDPTIGFIRAGDGDSAGDSMFFTLNANLASQLVGYRCSTHRQTMKGLIEVD